MKKIIPVYYLREKRISKIFKRPYKLPTKKTAMKHIAAIYAQLSPENLCCDGELRGAELQRKYKELKEALFYCESLLGKKVTELESVEWEMATEGKQVC